MPNMMVTMAPAKNLTDHAVILSMLSRRTYRLPPSATAHTASEAAEKKSCLNVCNHRDSKLRPTIHPKGACFFPPPPTASYIRPVRGPQEVVASSSAMASPYNDTHVQFDGHYFNETFLNEYNYSQSHICYLLPPHPIRHLAWS
jgi:hypothetical protein